MDRLLPLALSLVNKVTTFVAVKTLPWSNRSQHDAYLHGYKDGVKDGWDRRNLGLPRA